jgi:hypothetical protein
MYLYPKGVNIGLNSNNYTRSGVSIARFYINVP